jgi:hypothetical protein
MVADVDSRQFLSAAPFLSGFASGNALHHAHTYLLIALLAVVAGLVGRGFKNVLYKTEDLCDPIWKHHPESARPRQYERVSRRTRLWRCPTCEQRKDEDGDRRSSAAGTLIGLRAARTRSDQPLSSGRSWNIWR